KNERYNQRFISSLGREPHDSSWSVEQLATLLQRTKRPIKTALLDQHIVCGLGNIYVDEVLFESKIAPHRIAATLTTDEVKRIVNAMQSIINLAIESGGTTIRTYENSQGKKGTYSAQLKVYGRSGECCVNCKREITKMKLGGRGTHWCETCQI
ncbi:MAG: zinc finger domain-containing protein, partial [Bacilli bacterium]